MRSIPRNGDILLYSNLYKWTKNEDFIRITQIQTSLCGYKKHHLGVLWLLLNKPNR